MKKNYIYLLILLVSTICITLFLSNIYKEKIVKTSYLYEKISHITSTEFNEYMTEHSDVIIYVGNKTDIVDNKFEKSLLKKLEKLNLLENIIYIDKEDVNSELQKLLEKQYLYKYDEETLPYIIVVNDGKTVQKAQVNESSIADTIINYEVFKW